MRRVLFVDDEPRVLEGLQRLLRPRRHEWQMAFALSGQAALAELESASFDVVVSDMRMPGMDGATLLKHVQERFPDAVRLVLSGHTDRDALLRAVPVAHQFLTKPCDAAALQAAVERACTLQELLNDEALRRVVGELGELPSSPTVLTELVKALDDPDVPISELAGIIDQDVAMCAKCLQLVNTAFFGLAREVTSVQQAISFLGTAMLKNLTFSVGAFQAFSPEVMPAGFSLDTLQNHSLAVANLAARLLPTTEEAQQATMAAMLHDIGVLILAARIPDRYALVLETAKQQQRAFHAVEQELLGVTHAEVGAYLLGLWGLPRPIVEAVAYHHKPAVAGPARFDIVAAVHIANLLIDDREQALLRDDYSTDVVPKIDLEWLESMGVLEHLGRWSDMAADIVGRGRE